MLEAGITIERVCEWQKDGNGGVKALTCIELGTDDDRNTVKKCLEVVLIAVVLPIMLWRDQR